MGRNNSVRKEIIAKRNGAIAERFADLHKKGVATGKGIVVRMRRDDAITLIAQEFYLSRFTIERILIAT